MRTRTAALALALAAGTASLFATGSSGAAPSDGGSTSSAARTVQLRLSPSSPELAACFPRAHAHVDVALTTDANGADTFRIRAENLKRRTSFTIFLIEKAGAPFGAAEYIGDVTTDARGNAAGRFRLIVEEAFAFNNETGVRKDLNSVGMWFADPRDDNGCLGAGSPVTQFDGDASAGVQMLNSRARLLP